MLRGEKRSQTGAGRGGARNQKRVSPKQIDRHKNKAAITGGN